MANVTSTIQLKRNASTGVEPLTSELELGELAVNTYDGKVYLKKDDGSESIVEVGSNIEITTSGSSTDVAANELVFVTANSLTITLPASPTAGDRCYVGVGSNTGTIIGRNGEYIMGLAENMTIDVLNVIVGLIYVDATRGWRIL